MLACMMRRVAIVVLALWAGALVVNRALRRVEGPSMQPTMCDGDLLVTVPRRGRLDVGEVVVADVPGVGATVKRVAAVDRDGVVLLGDHAPRSTDSRHFGPVAHAAITHRVLWYLRR